MLCVLFLWLVSLSLERNPRRQEEEEQLLVTRVLVDIKSDMQSQLQYSSRNQLMGKNINIS
jgi:hypothetical protein